MQLVVNILIGVVKIELMMSVIIAALVQWVVGHVMSVMGHCGPVKLGCVGTSQDVGGADPVAVGVLGDLHEGLAGGGGD